MMPSNNPQKWRVLRESQEGTDIYLFAVNKTSICRQPWQNKLHITPRNWKSSLPTSLSVSQSLFQLKLLEIKTNTRINGIVISWTYGLEKLVCNHKQLYLHPATEERPHPTLGKKNVIRYLLVFFQCLCALLVLDMRIHLFSVLSITVPNNSQPPKPHSYFWYWMEERYPNK